MIGTMKYISSSTPPSSRIVFDYTIVPSSQNFLRRLVFNLLARKVAKIGEPWKSFYDPKPSIIALTIQGCLTNFEKAGSM